mmetsp:Transcript_20723/g.52219  ORF Transcript_20723/g.52219 Transcript_20723/m.52219 type:complete len:121 (+) Transcript_20723:158-520(+)|eukprot:g7121.t1
MSLSSRNFAHAKGLYRRILRVHRGLPDPVMRELGDVFVKKEFRIHCGPPDMHLNPVLPEQFRMFVRQWSQYCDQLEAGQVGQQMSRQTKQTLSPEQQLKLKDLRDTIRAGDFGAGGGGGG